MGRHKKEDVFKIMPTDVFINTESIKLDQLLKFASSSVSTGAEAKQAVLDGKVTLNGEVCLIRGKKVVAGDIVEVATLMECFMVCQKLNANGEPVKKEKSARQVAREFELKKAMKEKAAEEKKQRALAREEKKKQEEIKAKENANK